MYQSSNFYSFDRYCFRDFHCHQIVQRIGYQIENRSYRVKNLVSTSRLRVPPRTAVREYDLQTLVFRGVKSISNCGSTRARVTSVLPGGMMMRTVRSMAKEVSFGVFWIHHVCLEYSCRLDLWKHNWSNSACHHNEFAQHDIPDKQVSPAAPRTSSSSPAVVWA